MKWVPLHLHTHYSTLDGLSQPDRLAKRLEELEYTGCALSDHGNVSGFPSFFKECKKKGVKPIAGCEFYIADRDSSAKEKDNQNSHLVVLAKNKAGWLSLVQAVSESNHPNNFYRKPRLDLDRLARHCNGNLISFSGHPGSNLCKVIMDGSCYDANSVAEARQYVLPNAIPDACRLALKMQDVFGKGNFFIEIQLIDKDRLHMSVVLAEILRAVSHQTGIPCVATADSHYINREDAIDQRVLLCSSLKTTLATVNAKMASDEGFALSGFFKSNNYHVPSQDEMSRIHRGYEHELDNALAIYEMAEAYDISSKPKLPEFKCPNGLSQIEYLKELCREGWRQRMKGLPPEQKAAYSDRVLRELRVIEGAGLQGYFLIVQDYCAWAKKSMLVGPGRGSGAGSLLSYLLKITEIDPMAYGLMFERFYNAGRNTADNIAFPDIDTDFPVERRGDVITYLKETYGATNVCQIATFGRLMGRGALKEVLRVHDACDQLTANIISKCIPGESEISDDLEIMEQETGGASIIQWTLENDPEKLSEWVKIDKQGVITGPFAEYFKQAIRLEGTIKSTGKHASGLIISNEPIADVAPVEYDKKSGDVYAALEMGDLETMGQIKFDILGVSLLDKLQGAATLLRTGRIE